MPEPTGVLIAGPNLTLDRVLSIGELVPGGVLRATEALVSPGGKGVNVARVAAALGVPAVLGAFVRGRTGRADGFSVLIGVGSWRRPAASVWGFAAARRRSPRPPPGPAPSRARSRRSAACFRRQHERHRPRRRRRRHDHLQGGPGLRSTARSSRTAPPPRRGGRFRPARSSTRTRFSARRPTRSARRSPLRRRAASPGSG